MDMISREDEAKVGICECRSWRSRSIWSINPFRRYDKLTQIELLEDVISALDSPEGLHGAGLDVTDPEPLPDGHPLFTHPRVIVTPHTSGDFDGYVGAAVDLFLANMKRVREGGKPFNVVDPEKGY